MYLVREERLRNVKKYRKTSAMKRTVKIRLDVTPEQDEQLLETQQMFNMACNLAVAFAADNRYFNRVALHHLCYYSVREQLPLGSQMVCNAIKAVCDAYKTLKPKKDKPVKHINFKLTSSVHYDARTYSFQGDQLSLYTLSGRIRVGMLLGDFQSCYLQQGKRKEAELIKVRGKWYFNLVLDFPDAAPSSGNGVTGVDVGENNLAATSNGKIFFGNRIGFERDKHLAFRRRLQSNGSHSAKQLLRKVSGREQRRMKHVNHEISKAIVAEAVAINSSIIRMEDLTHIRKRIKAGKRVRSRLHRWAFRQLQDFIAYKAEGKGIQVNWVNPAYTSKTCSQCAAIGKRNKHSFSCTCGHQAHSDVNAASNIAWFAESFGSVRGINNVS